MQPRIAALFLLGTVLLAANASAATFVVNATQDAVDASPGDGVCDSLPALPAHDPSCTLRAAVMEANASDTADTIVLSPIQYTLSIQGRGEEAAAAGDLDIARPLTIDGHGAIIDAAGLDRVFDVQPFAQNSLFADLTITNGDVSGENRLGAGIYSATNITLDHIRIKHNQGIGMLQYLCPIDGTSVVLASEIADNPGGGLFSDQCALNIDSSSIYQNTLRALSFGGQRNLLMANTTISANTDIDTAAVVLTNLASVSILDSSIIHNAGRGLSASATANLYVANTAFSSNSQNCTLQVNEGTASWKSNFYDDASCSPGGDGDDSVIAAHGFFSPLGWYGGATPTHRPLSVSPAVDAASSCSGYTTDQRGSARPVAFHGQIPACDMGAVELESETIFFDSLEWF